MDLAGGKKNTGFGRVVQETYLIQPLCVCLPRVVAAWVAADVAVRRARTLAEVVSVLTLLKIVSPSVGFCSYCVLKITRSMLKITRSVLKMTHSRDQDPETFLSSFLSSSN